MQATLLGNANDDFLEKMFLKKVENKIQVVSVLHINWMTIYLISEKLE